MGFLFLIKELSHAPDELGHSPTFHGWCAMPILLAIAFVMGGFIGYLWGTASIQKDCIELGSFTTEQSRIFTCELQAVKANGQTFFVVPEPTQ